MRFTRILLYVVLISCLLVITIPATPARAATGAINIYPISGPPGTFVAVSGTGFTPGSAYTVHLSAANVATGSVDSGGAMSTGFTAPVLPRGPYAVTVTTGAPDGSNTATFNITPVITLDISSGRVGDTIKVSGSGFSASATISIVFDIAAATAATTDPSGSFSSVLITVPPTSPGKHNITGNDGFAYTPQVNFTVYPSVSLSPNVQTVGSQVTVFGSGFSANSPITFYIDNVAISSSPVTTDTGGSFSNGTIIIPPLPQGPHVLMAQDINYSSGASNLFVRPGLAISPQTGSPGATVQLTGNGFAANAAISITYNGASVTTAPATINTGTTGGFTASFTVPPGTTGTYQVQASDGANTATATFSIAAGANLNPTLGTVGTSVAISGSNFGASTTVTVTFDGAQVATAMTDASGTFSATFKAPSARAGGHAISAADNINSVTTSFTILPSASITPASGPVDGSATISGVGFGGGRAVTIRFDNTQVATATTDSLGAFSATFKTPNGSSGSHQVTASDSVNTVNANFTILAGASLSPASGYVDSSITVKGTGFAAGKAITCTFDKAQVAMATADALGAFSATFKAPPSPTGNHQVTATDGTNMATLTFAISPSMSLTPAAGYVGSNVSVKGAGFAPSKAITIKYDNTQLTPSTTDASGTFTAAFNAPASKGGNHTISVTDGTSTVTADFAMDSTPPAVPILSQPADAVQADAQTVFSWSPVTDPSGVTYTLQIATDPTFSSVVLEKKGLTTSGYTLSDQEKLKSASKEKPYYWRVKSVDSASNESPWSAARSFYVGFILSTTALYGIFAAIVIIVGILGFWLGRRTYSF